MNPENRLFQIIGEKFGVDSRSLSSGSFFTKDLGADVIDMIDLIMRIEEEFDLDIPDQKADRMKTVGQMVKYVSSRMKTFH
jgi:acyl carrier protein